MSWKTFFVPTTAKVLLFVLLMGGVNVFVIWFTGGVADATILVGFPLGFWPVGAIWWQGDGPPPPAVEFSWMNFILDVAFWYLASCATIALYRGVRRK